MIYDETTLHLIELISNIKARKIEIIIDKALSKYNQKKLDKKLIEKCKIGREKLGMIEAEITVRHSTGQEEPCLQAVDFVCGAVFNKYERGNSSYYGIIERKIIKTEEIK